MRLVALAAVLVLLAAPAAAAPARHYYLALGDSLAVGMQPDAAGVDRPSRDGYAERLAAHLRASVPDLGLAQLGCPGETTRTMLAANPCHAAGGSQIGAAERFLRRHRGRVSLVTLDIGDNDVERCFRRAGLVDRPCVAAGIAAVRTNLPAIVARLRAAAGGPVAIVGIADYDQFLAYWRRGAAGRAAARRSLAVIRHLNRTLDATYAGTGVITADAAASFATSTTPPMRGGPSEPPAVSHVCALTWACSGPPIGLDDHANAGGYAVIATVIERALDRRPGLSWR